MVIPAKYDQTMEFDHGLAYVRIGDHDGYIGVDGTEYFEP